ncbi:MAG: DUF4430 domain-containing protein [Ruminococcus sp.]|nr:DUF4430 domain-containing protein [Ruminococcus sp.]
MNGVKAFLFKNKYTFCGIAVAIVVLIVAYCSGGSLSENNNAATSDSIVSTTVDSNVTVTANVNETAKHTKNNTKSNLSQKIKAKERPTVAVTANDSTKNNGEQGVVGNVSNITNSIDTNHTSSNSDNKDSTQSEDTTSPKQSTEKDKYLTDPIPEGKPKPVEPQEQVISDDVLTCTFSISCATILNNMDDLDPDKVELVPDDGWIFKPAEVQFNEGESVYEILQRVCMDNKIKMEYSWTPIYNSVYIEGIHDLYEFDCGSLSGWMYSVNDWFPNYGCSRYEVQNNDVICWKYTCNLGNDIGGNYAVGG